MPTWAWLHLVSDLFLRQFNTYMVCLWSSRVLHGSVLIALRLREARKPLPWKAEVKTPEGAQQSQLNTFCYPPAAPAVYNQSRMRPLKYCRGPRGSLLGSHATPWRAESFWKKKKMLSRVVNITVKTNKYIYWTLSLYWFFIKICEKFHITV